jgi:hypothetical protein
VPDDLTWFCRNCWHMTKPIGVGVCLWCKSLDISEQPKTVVSRRAMGVIPEPEDREPTKHQRLQEGFAILRQGGDL